MLSVNIFALSLSELPEMRLHKMHFSPQSLSNMQFFPDGRWLYTYAYINNMLSCCTLFVDSGKVR